MPTGNSWQLLLRTVRRLGYFRVLSLGGRLHMESALPAMVEARRKNLRCLLKGSPLKTVRNIIGNKNMLTNGQF